MSAEGPADNDLHWGIPGSVSNANTLEQIKDFVTKIGLNGIEELNTAMGTLRSVTNNIESAIDTHIVSNADDPNSPIILMINYPPGPNLPRHDPRTFAIHDYVIVYTNNTATAINASPISGIYQVIRIIDDDTVMVKPGPIPTSPLEPPVIPKNRCALLKKYNGRIIIMCIEHNPSGQSSNGGAKSSRRRKRRPSRSKSVNKKRKYTQQRLRRSRRHRRSHRR